MAPVVRIPDETYERLESHAIGFDTPYNVIERLLDFYEENQTNKSASIKKKPRKSSVSAGSSQKKARNIQLERSVKKAIGKTLAWGDFKLANQSVLEDYESNKRILCKYSSYSPDLERWFWGIPEKYWSEWDDEFYLALILENDNQKGYSFLLLEPEEVTELISRCGSDSKNEKKVNLRFYKSDHLPHIQEWKELDVDGHMHKIDNGLLKHLNPSENSP